MPSWTLLPIPVEPIAPISITKVHIVFMTHLDVGYADQIAGIVNRYFGDGKYFDQAIATAKQLRQNPNGPQYMWTQHAWLINMYLDCPPGLCRI